VEILNIEDAVRFAQKIARKMSQDPEVDSIAGEAAWRAMCSWDQSKNVKLSWWIAQLTKQSVIHYWRKLARLRAKEKFRNELWWAEQTKLGRVSEQKLRLSEDNLILRHPDTESEIELKFDDWQLLVESYILRWPLDVIARERSISLGEARRLRLAAISRLEAVC